MMKLPKSLRGVMGLCLLLALSTSLSACATNKVREGSKQAAEARESVKVIETVRTVRERAEVLPAWPEVCKKQHKAGVVESDGADVALVKYDAALGRANAQISSCADYYDQLQKRRAAQ